MMEDFDVFVDTVAEQMIALWHYVDPAEDKIL